MSLIIKLLYEIFHKTFHESIWYFFHDINKCCKFNSIIFERYITLKKKFTTNYRHHYSDFWIHKMFHTTSNIVLPSGGKMFTIQFEIIFLKTFGMYSGGFKFTISFYNDLYQLYLIQSKTNLQWHLHNNFVSQIFQWYFQDFNFNIIT